MKRSSVIKWIAIPGCLIFLIFLGLVVTAVFVLPSRRGDDSSEKDGGGGWSLFAGKGKGKQVRVAKVERGPVVATISAPGIVTAAREVAISSRLAGRVMELFADEGDHVEEGQAIARLETKEFEIALEREKSNLDVAAARLERAQASLASAKVAAKRSAVQLERKESLYRQGGISVTDVELARNQADTDRLQETVASKGLREGEEAARSARLALEEVERDLSETEIRTPLTGTVSVRNVNVGERVILGIAGDPSAALFIISDLSQILIYARVDESDVTRVKEGQPVEIRFDALKDVEFAGRTIDVAPRANRSGEISTFRTRILVEGDTSSLRSGMSAHTEIEVERLEDALIVPIETVVDREKSPEDDDGDEKAPDERAKTKGRKKEYVKKVFRVEDGVATGVEVETGISDNTNIEILSGLEVGDVIVTGPYRVLDDLKDGDVVRVKPSPDEEKDPEKEEGDEEEAQADGESPADDSSEAND